MKQLLAKQHNQSNKEMTIKLGTVNKYVVLKCSLFLLLGALIYSNALNVPFYFDDMRNIQNNPHMRLSKITPGTILESGLRAHASNRPIANVSFALNYYFCGGNVTGYHKVNIIIHVLAGILLYLLVRMTLHLPSVRTKYENHSLIALFAALLWFVHPIQTQSVTYIVQRMNSMAAMFYLLSFLLYVKGRLVEGIAKRVPWFAGALVAGVLALGSKEIAATLPFFIILYEWYFFQDLSKTWLKRHVPYFVATLFILVFCAWFYLGSNPFEKILSDYARRDFTLTERALTEFRVVIFYISLLLYPNPSRLNLDHDFPLSRSLIDPVSTSVSIGIIIMLIGFAIFIAKREKLISFCIFWFLGNLVIESSIIGLEILFEHRNYLPSMFFSLCVVVLAYRYIRANWAVAIGLSGAICLFCFWTYQRNNVWKDPVVFWRDCATKSENKARPHYNLANALTHRKGGDREAIAYYTKAIKIEPDHVMAHSNLGAVLAGQGKLKEAIEHYSEALRINPNMAHTHYNLGNALALQGKLEKAVAHYSEALTLEPSHSFAQEALRVTLARQTESERTSIDYSDDLQTKSRKAEYHHNKGLALAKQGKLEEAITHFSEAVRLKPDDADAQNALGVALARQGKFDEAIHHYHQALWCSPNHAFAHHNLGGALAGLGKFQEAADHYLEALRIKPNYAEAHNDLGIALAKQGKLEEAITHFSEAVRLRPGYADAQNNLRKVLEMSTKSD